MVTSPRLPKERFPTPGLSLPVVFQNDARPGDLLMLFPISQEC